VDSRRGCVNRCDRAREARSRGVLLLLLLIVLWGIVSWWWGRRDVAETWVERCRGTGRVGRDGEAGGRGRELWRGLAGEG
jgi:hypothetical protein